MTRRICQWTANPREKAQGMEMEPQKTNSHRQEKIFLKCKYHNNSMYIRSFLFDYIKYVRFRLLLKFSPSRQVVQKQSNRSEDETSPREKLIYTSWSLYRQRGD